MRKLNVLLMFALLMFSLQSFGQRKVSGTVTSAADKDPLLGVSVLIKGTTTGTMTDFDGMYELTVPDQSSVLVFTFVGFDSKEVTVGANMVINVALSSGIELEEVVVTALGISKEKKSLGYAVTQVTSEDIVKGGDRSVLNSIQGRVPGIEISSSVVIPEHQHVSASGVFAL